MACYRIRLQCSELSSVLQIYDLQKSPAYCSIFGQGRQGVPEADKSTPATPDVNSAWSFRMKISISFLIVEDPVLPYILAIYRILNFQSSGTAVFFIYVFLTSPPTMLPLSWSMSNSS
jgi:hypothetical protein